MVVKECDARALMSMLRSLFKLSRVTGSDNHFTFDFTFDADSKVVIRKGLH